MSTENETISIGNVSIGVVRKDIKNMHLAVYPPKGRIRLSAPAKTDYEVLRLFAISKLGWIKKHVKNFQEQHREPPRQFISGESHYYHGRRYLLEVKEGIGPQEISVKNSKKLLMQVRPGANKDSREKLMREWYRERMKEMVPELLATWEDKIGVKANDWGIKLMQTKWGSCNPDAKRIWLNLELAKKPKICLEYILVHELVHLLERNHNDRFVAYMDEFMPKWRLYRNELNKLPVARGEWGY